MLHGNQQRITAALALIGQGKRNEARISALQLPEYRADVRRIAVDIRHHHDHIPRAQLGVGTEAREQLVMEDLDFPLRAVGYVKTDRLILRQIHDWP
ncbi:hypothetical protein D3C81_1356890 [compost metagenome]